MKTIKYAALLFVTAVLFSCSTANKTLYIASETQPCTGVGKMECMLVKKDKNQADWEYFYSNIEGFTYETGYEYELLVKESHIEHPPADAPSIKYTLVKIVNKTKK